MPGKSRRQKEKKMFKPVAISEIPASINPPAVTVTLNQPSPVVKSAAPAVKAATAASSYVNRELLTITLMAGLMLVVVIVLSIILS